MIFGVVKRTRAITTHHESPVRSLAGKKVAILPETVVEIKGYGLRVDVTPADLLDKLPVSILARHIIMDDHAAKQLNRAAQR